MTKKLLYQFDTDTTASVFDSVVAYDGGADQVTGIGNVNAQNVLAMVDGCIYTRAPKDKQFTAIFVGGSSLTEGQAVFDAIKKRFFSNFRVSVMFDSNGSNTTAAAAVANIVNTCDVSGKKAVILGGTGPVGQRAAALLSLEKADVFITSRNIEKAEQISTEINKRFDTNVEALPGGTNDERVTSISGASIVMATGASGVVLLNKKDFDIFNSMIIITEDKESILRFFAKKNKIQFIEHNPNIGGRFSVLSETGMLPFLDKTEIICQTPCSISDNFNMSSWDMSNVKSMYFTETLVFYFI